LKDGKQVLNYAGVLEAGLTRGRDVVDDIDRDTGEIQVK
jgi:hypothetical protein